MAKANVSNTLVVPSESTVHPYYDDFNEEKNFKRILFRPGYAVQARELTQIQTILQNQIERFGQHIFENGSPVLGGDVSWDPTKRGSTINLESTYLNTEISIAAFKNRTITLTTPNADNTVRFQVVQVSPATATEPPALVGNFLLGDREDIPAGATIMTRVDNNNSDVFYANLTVAEPITSSLGTFAFVKEGVFFFNGYFIKVPSQAAIVNKYQDISEVNLSVGLEFNDDIITEISDSTLLDPAQEAFNYQAPGAARYKAELILSTRTLDSTDRSKYVELIRIEKGILRKLIQFPLYSEIEEVMARRTYDESGNYTVRPFVLNMEEDLVEPNDYVSARLSPGKAYVYGYEFETIAPTDIRIPRARTRANVTNYALNLNHGNYVIVDGVDGVFDTAFMKRVDIHCVPTTSANLTNAQAYATTVIGSARVKDVNFYSGDTDVTTRKYEFYFFDTQFKPITGNAIWIGTDTNKVSFYNTSSLSTATNAYANATLRVVSGPGRGYTYRIASYDASTKKFTISLDNFTEAVANTSNLSLEFDFTDAESFIVSPSFTAGSPTYKANANITTLNKKGGVASGDAYITEPSLNTLLFPLPEKYVANGVYNTAYQYRRRYDSVIFTSGFSNSSPIVAASFGGNPLENFIGANSTSSISSTVMDNFYVVVTSLNDGTTTRKVGDVLKVTTSVSGSPESVTFSTGTSTDNVTATVFAKMQYSSNVAPKLKSLVLANTNTLTTETAVSISSGPTGSSVAVYEDSGQIVITNPTRRVGIPESLYISDVIGISKIYDLAGTAATAGMELGTFTDVTERFDFDNGQKEAFYDHASIRLKPGYMSCVGPLVVCFRYYKHSQPVNAGGYFVVDSYPELSNTVFEEGTSLGLGYSLIPDFVNKAGQAVSLRDCIDFRPARGNATNTHPNFAYALNDYSAAQISTPIAATDFDINYQYYMGRKDLLVLKADKTFARIEGVPSKFPQDPPIPSRSMVLYTLTVQPYTAYPSNVNVRYIENKRYTMRDIGKIEKRVENLEYYVQLNSLEQSAVNQPIRDVDGLDRTKYGIFADSFVGHSLGNSNLFDYKCAMNFNAGWLQCKNKTLGFNLIANTDASSGVVFYRDKVLLDNEETMFIMQDVASKWAALAEYMFATFNGKIFCLPEADIWKSVHKAPDIVVVDAVEREHVNFDVQVIQDPNGTYFDTIVNSGSRGVQALSTSKTTSTTTSKTSTITV